MASDEKINLKVVQKYDQYCTEILDKSGRTALYLFHSSENEWCKTKTEGVFFYYKRSMVPFYAFLILNTKLSSANQVEYITPELQLQLQLPFLLYKNQRGNIHSIWFYSEEDCERLAHSIGKRVREMGGSELKIGARKLSASGQQSLAMSSSTKSDHQSTTTPITPGSGSLDIFQMLSKAKKEAEGHSNHHEPAKGVNAHTSLSGPNPRPIDLKDLFASTASKTNVATSHPGPSGSHGFLPFTGQGVVRPVAQRPKIVHSDSSAGGMTVEQLERMLVNSSNHATSNHPNQVHMTAPTNGNPAANMLVSPMVLSASHRQDPRELEHNSETVFVEMLGKMLPESTHKSKIEEDDDEVITPAMMLAQAANREHHHVPSLGAPPTTTRPAQGDTPQRGIPGLHLTKDQLKEALVYLLQEDTTFLNKIHEAYLKTLERRLNSST